MTIQYLHRKMRKKQNITLKTMKIRKMMLIRKRTPMTRKNQVAAEAEAAVRGILPAAVTKRMTKKKTMMAVSIYIQGRCQDMQLIIRYRAVYPERSCKCKASLAV